MGVKTVDTMWCVTLASVIPYIAYRDFSFATPPIRGRVVSPTIQHIPKKGYYKTPLILKNKEKLSTRNRKSKLRPWLLVTNITNCST